MTDAITTTVSWDDLITAYDSELAEYREAYADLREYVADEFDTDLSTPTDDDDLTAIQQQAARYEQGVEEVQKRQHMLETLRDRLGEGDFKIKMLSGRETMRIEKAVRAAVDEETPIGVVQTRRNQRTVDAATVAAPEGVPTDDDGSPTPSEAPNALTLALWEQVERFNNAGAVDFRPAGCGDGDRPVSAVGSSPAPTTSAPASEPSVPTDDA